LVHLHLHARCWPWHCLLLDCLIHSMHGWSVETHACRGGTEWGGWPWGRRRWRHPCWRRRRSRH
jgi:hypothetical protein